MLCTRTDKQRMTHEDPEADVDITSENNRISLFRTRERVNLATAMATLTTLPLSLQSRILSYVCDIRLTHQHTQLHGTSYYIPSRYPRTKITLDSLHAINVPFPPELLAPALASPVLAAAAEKVIGPRLSYLSDVNTGGHLKLWVKAFSTYVHAVGITRIGDVAKELLPRVVRRMMVEKLCRDAVDLFQEISLNHVRLKVLDVVHVPFDRCYGMKDDLIASFCSILESCQSTLKELALPVYRKSDICVRVLETITLPYLTVFSIEMKAKHASYRLRYKERLLLENQLSNMMRAVDGHADRLHKVTTLEELRLINIYSVPYMSVTKSGCSSGFFHAIKTLRMSMFPRYAIMRHREAVFFGKFSELEYLHWTGVPRSWSDTFKCSKSLKEVNFCHHEWITGAKVGIQMNFPSSDFIFHVENVLDAIEVSNGKSRTLVVTYGIGLSHDLRHIARSCPNLGYLSLQISRSNMSGIRCLIQRCQHLAGLQIVIDECRVEKLGEQGWLELGEVVSTYHPKLRDVAILTKWDYSGPGIRADTAAKCFKTVIERMGARVERLLFRVIVDVQTVERGVDLVRCILDSCVDHARGLVHLQVDVIPWNRVDIIESYDVSQESLLKLAASRDMLIRSQPRLFQLDLGICHRLLRSLKPTEEINSFEVLQ